MRRETADTIMRLLAAAIVIAIGLWGIYELNKLSLDAVHRIPPLSFEMVFITIIYVIAFTILVVLILVGLALLVK